MRVFGKSVNARCSLTRKRGRLARLLAYAVGVLTIDGTGPRRLLVWRGGVHSPEPVAGDASGTAFRLI